MECDGSIGFHFVEHGLRDNFFFRLSCAVAVCNIFASPTALALRAKKFGSSSLLSQLDAPHTQNFEI
jgi:hypothetical protein